jgi:DNA-binding NarL/FixJ family response regulator
MNILLADDHPLMLDAMRITLSALAPGARIDGVIRLKDAIERAAAAGYDYAVLDLGLPDASGVEVIERFKAATPDLPVIVFSATVDRPTIIACLDAGAMGFIPKTVGSEVLINALRLIFSGAIYVPPEAIGPVLAPAADAADALDLTPRQREVMAMLLMGLPNKHICRALGIAEPTVKIHVAAVLRALGASNRTQAVLNASRLGVRLPVPGQSVAT